MKTTLFASWLLFVNYEAAGKSVSAEVSAPALEQVAEADQVTRLNEAMRMLMNYWNQYTGQFDGVGWWNNGNAINAVADYMYLTGSREYENIIDQAYELNKNRFDGGFQNEYYDDTEWWACGFVRAYDVTGRKEYLDTAVAAADYIYSSWDDNYCSGGVLWRRGDPAKNAVANEGFMKLEAMLANRLNDAAHYERANKTLTWFKKSGMIIDNLIVDGLDVGKEGCPANTKATIWSYNQGSILGALVEMYQYSKDTNLIILGQVLADMSSSTYQLNRNGLMHDAGGDDNNAETNYDGVTFKGIYIRNLGEISRHLKGRYDEYIKKQAQAIWTYRDPYSGQFGNLWWTANTIKNVEGISVASAVEAMIAAYWEPKKKSLANDDGAASSLTLGTAAALAVAWCYLAN